MCRGESDVKGDVSGGSHEDDGEEIKGWAEPRADHCQPGMGELRD